MTVPSRQRFGVFDRVWPVLVGALVLATGAPAALASGNEENVLAGVVVDAEGEPVEGAKVHVTLADSGGIFYSGPEAVHSFGPEERVLLFFRKRNAQTHGDTATDEDGRFKIVSLKPGKYSLLVMHKDRGLAVVADVEQPNPEDPITVRLNKPTWVEQPAMHIAGQTLSLWQIDQESPAPGVMIQVRAFNMGMSEQGVGPLLPDAPTKLVRQVFSMKRGFSAKVLEVPVTLKAGEATKVDPNPGGEEKLAGTVIGPDGKAMDEVVVTLTSASGEALLVGDITDEKGQYTIEHIPKGEYTLEAKRWAKRTGPG